MSLGHSQDCLISIFVIPCIWWLYWAIYLAQTLVVVHDSLISFIHVACNKYRLVFWKSVPKLFN
jgi:hypothetical protein